MPERRTVIVLGSLVMSMTLAAAVLLALEPQPVLRTSDIRLNAIDQPRNEDDGLLNTTRPLNQWMAIVIHDSGALGGTIEALATAHQQAGLGGLGCHFVIHNGKGHDDGAIASGPRWRHQQPGAYYVGPDADWFNRFAIGVCMIGDFRRQAPTDAQTTELVTLVRRLQKQFNIPAERVLVRAGGDQGPGALFPLATFQRQLLTAAAP